MQTKATESTNKKVLIITYYWPPSGGAGVQRWLKFAKYLPEFGWQPIVYTPENPHFSLKDESLLKDVNSKIRVIKRKIWEPYQIASFITGRKDSKINTGNLDHTEEKRSFKQRVLAYIRANWIIPDPRKFWIKPSVKYLKRLISEENIQIIITTGPPHSMHLIGYSLKKSNPHLKWIADFRDPWSQLDFYDTLPISIRSLDSHRQLEKKVVNLADTILATSPSMYQQLETFDLEKFHCITNGYDTDDFSGDPSIQKNENHIRITHAGLLKSERNPVNLWKGIKKWIHANAENPLSLSIVCAGYVDSSIEKQLLSDKEIGKFVSFPGYLERNDLQKLYLETQIFILLVNNTRNSKVNIPGKLFEYLATGKKILVVCKKTDDVVLLLQPYTNALIVDYSDKPEIFLASLDTLISKRSEEVPKAFISQFSRKNLSKKLVDLLETHIDT